jgi:hypothetical protein
MKPLVDVLEKMLQGMINLQNIVETLQDRVQGLEERERTRAVAAMRDKRKDV